MYFIPELLIARKRGKFAKCWLAAKLSRVNFSRKYRRDTVLQIDVINTCDQLIPHIVGTDSTLRFSLSLSADLMIGIVKIYYYQIDVILQRCLEFRTNIKTVYVDEDDLKNRKKKRHNKDLIASEEMYLLPPGEIAIAETDFNQNLANEADITLRELGGRNHAFETMIRAADQLNFGALTGEQMDQLLQPGGLCSGSPSSARAFLDPALPTDLPLPEIESSATSRIFKIPGTPKGRKTSRNGTGTAERAAQRNKSLDNIPTIDVPTESFVTTLTTDVIPLPGTPTKHKLPLENDVTSSPKRRRGLLNEFDSDSTERQIPVAPFPIAVPAVTAIPSDNDTNFGPLDEILNAGGLEKRREKSKNKKKKKIFADENTQLLQQNLRRDIDDLFFKTRAFTALEDRVRHIRISAADLLSVPSTGQRWGKTLLLNYQMIILEPISQTLPVDSDIGINFAIDPIREPDSSTVERSGELSGEVIGKAGISGYETSSKDHSKTLEVISIVGTSTPRIEVQHHHHPVQEAIHSTEQEIPPDLSDYLTTVEEQPLVTDQRKSLKNYPKAVRNIFRDWSENGKTPDKESENRSGNGSEEKNGAADLIVRTSSGSFSQPASSSSGRSQEISDLLGRLESFWAENPVVNFKELCPFDGTKRKYAGLTFTHLLELSRLKEVKLTQASPYNHIYIQKYSPYF